MDYTLILKRKYSGAEWILDGDDYEGLNWLSDSAKPTKQELDALWDTVKKEIEAEKQAKVEARKAAEAKLEALGLSVADLRALGL